MTMPAISPAPRPLSGALVAAGEGDGEADGGGDGDAGGGGDGAADGGGDGDAEGGGDGEAEGGGDGGGDGGGGVGGGEQKLADQLYSFVKVETFFHASCISCLLQSSDSSAVPSNVRRIVVTELASQTSSWLKALAL